MVQPISHEDIFWCELLTQCQLHISGQGVLLSGTSKLAGGDDVCRHPVSRGTTGVFRVCVCVCVCVYISSAQVRKQFGMEETLEDIIAARRLCWLGHLARMDEDRIPKKLLFGWLPQRRPAHGTKLRWKDKVRQDLKRFGIDEASWFRVAQERGLWRARCKEGLDVCTEKRMVMDRARHMMLLRLQGKVECWLMPTSHVIRARDPLEDSKTLPDTSVRPLADVVGSTPDINSALGSVCHFVAEKHHPL